MSSSSACPCAVSPRAKWIVLSAQRRFAGSGSSLAVRNAYPGYAGPWPRIQIWQGASDSVLPPALSENHAGHFTGRYERRVLPGVGHNPPQEAPKAFADAILTLIRSG